MAAKIWTIKARDARRITVAEMKHMRRKQDTFGQITKKITKELKIMPILDKIQEKMDTTCK
jgi:hypothetical protein